jgi:hypothetical protein
MRRHLLPASFLLLLIGLAGCAHQSAGGGGGYAGSAFGDCEFGEDCYGPDTNRGYTCVFFEAPAMPARLAITGTQHHGSPRVVDRGRTPGSPPMDSSGSASASMSAASAAPPPVMREPVVVASPSGDRAPAPIAPRTPN